MLALFFWRDDEYKVWVLCLKILLNRFWVHGNAGSLTESLILDHQSQAIVPLQRERKELSPIPFTSNPDLCFPPHTQKAPISAKQGSAFTPGEKTAVIFLHTIITAISSTQVKPKQTKGWKLQGSGRNRKNHLQESSRASSAALRHKPLHFFPMTCKTQGRAYGPLLFQM